LRAEILRAARTQSYWTCARRVAHITLHLIARLVAFLVAKPAWAKL